MAEDKKVEIENDTGEETAKGEEQSSAREVVKKPKATKAAASKEAAPAKAKKSTAIEEIMAAIKNMTVLELSDLVYLPYDQVYQAL